MLIYKKKKFIKECVKQGKAAKTAEEKNKLKSVVLGLAPFDGDSYWTWSKFSRHPNYAGEFFCWCSYSIYALPSVFSLNDYWMMPIALLALISVPCMFYDCLCYWTGAEPAEHGSVQRRPRYKEYQSKLPVLFPTFGLLNEHKVAGWPHPKKE